ASRARTPFGTDVNLEQRHGQLGPDATTVTHFVFDFTEHKRKPWSGESTQILEIKSEPALTPRVPVDLPTVLMHASHADVLDAYAWPMQLESLLVHQLRISPLYMESIGSYWRGDWEVLFDPDKPLGAISNSLILTGLSL